MDSPHPNEQKACDVWDVVYKAGGELSLFRAANEVGMRIDKLPEILEVHPEWFDWDATGVRIRKKP